MYPFGFGQLPNRNYLFIMKKFLFIISTAIILVSCSASKSAVASKTSLPASIQNENTTYSVGDYYNQNGLRGIVVLVDQTGKHGKILSLESSQARWSNDKKFDFETNAFYEDDGTKNMQVIAKYIADGNASWNDFPIFEWARSLGDGWYIAAKGETLEIWMSITGGETTYKIPMTRFGSLKNKFNDFDKAQRQLGGAKMVDDRFEIGTKQPYYWYTSTEGEGGVAYAIGIDMANFKNAMLGSLSGNSKYGFQPMTKVLPNISKSTVATRAVHKF